MPCYHPIRAYVGRQAGRNGRFPVVFKFDDSCGREIDLPCGNCIGCRLDKAKEWALRCVHESQMHQENCFITLTYDDEHLPVDQSLDVGHWQKFMKRLRKQQPGKKIRYFHCGEYGEKFSRPHYHAILFNHDYPDRVRFGEGIDTSQSLEDCWGKGFTTVGEVTYESCRYVARYITKKVTGDRAREHYITFDRYTDRQYEIAPEYATMSRGSGIGKGWLEKFGRDVYPDGFIVHDAVKHKPPRYYEKWFEGSNQEAYKRLKAKRREIMAEKAEDLTDQRLRDREKVELAKAEIFNKRKYEA